MGFKTGDIFDVDQKVIDRLVDFGAVRLPVALKNDVYFWIDANAVGRVVMMKSSDHIYVICDDDLDAVHCRLTFG